MKKLIFALLTILLLGNINLDRVLAVEETSDASCSNVGESGYKEVGFEAPDEQTFTPGYDRLTKIDIIVGGHMWGVDGINFTLYNAIGTVVGSGSIAPTINGGPTVRTWTPASPISVRKGVTYRFRVENPNTADFVWYTGNNDCYSGGNARQKNANQNFDFGFTTFGYNSATATPAPTATPATENTMQSTDQDQSVNNETQTNTNDSSSNTSLNAGSASGSGEAPSANTSSSIAEPTGLQIAQSTLDNKPILTLNWSASKATDIDGYKVFRSESEKSGYKNISKLGKTIVEFKDTEIQVGKTYFYQIRAYKAVSESKSSNTVSKLVEAVAIESPAPSIVAMPITDAIPLEVKPKTNWWPLIIIILLLLIAALILYRLKKWPFTKHNNLINNITGGGMAEEAKKNSSTVVWIVVAIVVIIAGLAIWYFTKSDSSSDTTSTTDTQKAAVTIPDGWLGFTSNKYHFSLSYPSDYTLTESAVGTIKLTKGDQEMIDMYVYAANGDEAGMMSSTEALYTDDAKGYMIMDSVVQGKVAGFASKTIAGKFGKNAGVSQTHEGVTGSTAFFTTDDKLFVFDSYDNADATAQKTFADLLGTISF